MMKHITLLFFIGLCSCEHTNNQKVIVQTTQQKTEIEKPFSNPNLIYGSSFGSYFQSLYRTNQFEQMLCFTSSITLNRFTRELVLNYYKNDFRFDYILGNLSNISVEDGTTILTYSKASIYATRRKLKISCVVETDSVKIILNSLSNKPFE